MPELNKEYIKDIVEYHPETGLFTWAENVQEYIYNKVPDTPAGTRKKDEYSIITILNKKYFAHNLAWFLVYGYLSNGSNYIVDHINHKKHDNRIKNLRLIPPYQNNLNRSKQKNSSTGESNILYDTKKDKFVLQIRKKGKQRYMRMFANIEDAILVRDEVLLAMGFHENHGK